jgi:hypothetical protein
MHSTACAVDQASPAIARTAPEPAAGRRCVGVRAALLAKYEAIVAQWPDEPSWTERVEAICCGDVLVEPGWMLTDIVREPVDTFGLYRVYPDGRVERDRHIERLERERFLNAGGPLDE